MSSTMRVVLGIGVVAVAVVLLVVLKDDGGEGSGSTNTTAASKKRVPPGATKPEVPTIVVENGKPVGGIAEITVNEGEQVHFRVDSDVSDEVHLHGYDIMKDVEAGGSVTFDFPATIEGIFEAELEGRKEQILELRVTP